MCYHADAAAGAGVPQVVVQQLGGSVLEGFGQGAQQHGELWSVELKQGDQNHLGRLHTHTHTDTEVCYFNLFSGWFSTRSLSKHNN